MDTGVSIRPVLPSSTTPVRTDYAPERQTVRTELPEVAAVTPPASTFDVREQGSQRSLRAELSAVLDNKERSVGAKESQRRVSYNDDAGEVVISRVDPDTGSVINQFPDDAILRQRAYVRQSLTDTQQAENQLTKFVVA
jgi:uncharacterized FlaG/YvyC family protein